MEWRIKLDIFLSDFEHMKDVVGVMVCGSYITGNPGKHSDLDVHIILDNNVKYRERGNRVIDGLVIEYFANPPYQILRYFDEDLTDKSLMSQVQFATGEIIMDEVGEVAALKEKAIAMIDDFYVNPPDASVSELAKYFMWDMLDDLQDAHETNRADFDFLYFTALDSLLREYTSAINRPYNRKAILGNIQDAHVREKYLLRELPDETISRLISGAITATGKNEKVNIYQQLTNAIWDKFGGFNIDGFRLKGGLNDL
ncbi:MAG: nucleotidyltransferase domain-containing protein [Defluviitaleaceae bacterium]|nr:nucleotidyltransferase domain-containing protein [Defluviitaleaceae bacterium]MCL2218004.1 nucleotidyltransferase domain-containing protein [Defluviitaleaceae bacterium]